jgi:hypothetical protein
MRVAVLKFAIARSHFFFPVCGSRRRRPELGIVPCEIQDFFLCFFSQVFFIFPFSRRSPPRVDFAILIFISFLSFIFKQSYSVPTTRCPCRCVEFPPPPNANSDFSDFELITTFVHSLIFLLLFIWVSQPAPVPASTSSSAALSVPESEPISSAVWRGTAPAGAGSSAMATCDGASDSAEVHAAAASVDSSIADAALLRVLFPALLRLIDADGLASVVEERAAMERCGSPACPRWGARNMGAMDGESPYVIFFFFFFFFFFFVSSSLTRSVYAGKFF